MSLTSIASDKTFSPTEAQRAVPAVQQQAAELSPARQRVRCTHLQTGSSTVTCKDLHSLIKMGGKNSLSTKQKSLPFLPISAACSSSLLVFPVCQSLRCSQQCSKGLFKSPAQALTPIGREQPPRSPAGAGAAQLWARGVRGVLRQGNAGTAAQPSSSGQLSREWLTRRGRCQGNGGRFKCLKAGSNGYSLGEVLL